MPSAKLTLDFDTRKFFNADGSAIQAFSGKKNSVREYELSVTQNNVALSLPDGTTLSAALKKPSDPAGTLLSESTGTRAGWGTGSRWFFILDLSDDAFNTVLGFNVDFEVRMELPDGQIIPSLTIPFKIEKNVMA